LAAALVAVLHVSTVTTVLAGLYLALVNVLLAIFTPEKVTVLTGLNPTLVDVLLVIYFPLKQ
jgi:hypothetical protein